MKMRVPAYNLRPIGSVRSLARALGVSPSELEKLASQASKYYFPNAPQEKPSGGLRQTYRVSDRLKKVQDRILAQILRRVEFPPYLFAVNADDYPRDYIADAYLHAGAQTLICVDIKDYFPSIRGEFVQRVWQHFFDFPPPVAEVLTDLSLYNDYLPQGASTSSHLAVLLLFEVEPRLELSLREQGFHYSRYIDDIYVSAWRACSSDEKEQVLSSLIGMMYRYKLSPNRKKIEIGKHSSRMRVHNLNVGSGRPTKPKEERSRIRAAVKNCEEMAMISRATEEYRGQWRKTQGRVLEMSILHPGEAGPLLVRLDAIPPALHT